MDSRKQYGLFLILFFFIASNEGSNDFIIQTVQTDDGQIFDCFDINKQPALNHPSLKDHKIQMSPSSYPSTMNEENSSRNYNLEVQMTKIPCPSGTVSILRINQQDAKRNPVFPMFTNMSISNSDKTQTHVARLARFGNIYGSKVSLSVYEPDLSAGQDDRFSGAYFDIYYENEGMFIGWDISPTKTGDNYVRLYGEWGVIGSCSMPCPGFVQVRSDFAFGAILRPVSAYNGEQHRITLSMFKDPKTGNWWLTYGQEGKAVGYWPKSIFKNMDKAYTASWGGLVLSNLNEPSPPMGSGHFASEGFRKAAFCEDINIVNDKNQFVVPDPIFCVTENWNKKCYTMSKVGMNKAGLGFFFGGPGGCRG